jgi:hypothetical protein
VLGAGDGGGLRTLPGREHVPAPAASVCPSGAPVRSFAVAAIDVALPMLSGTSPPGTGKIFVLTADEQAVRSGARPAEPLVLHVDVGDCIAISLRNDTAAGPVSLHADQLAVDPASSAGVAAGRRRSVPPPPSCATGATWPAIPASVCTVR